MPAHYDIKAIGDQVHKLTLELEVEKTLTSFLLHYLQSHGILKPGIINNLIDGKISEPLDPEGKLFLNLRKARLVDIRDALAKSVGGND